jgi:hypothetical protein
MQNIYTFKILIRKLQEIKPLCDVRVDGKIILKQISENIFMEWIGFSWLYIRCNGRLW